MRNKSLELGGDFHNVVPPNKVRPPTHLFLLSSWIRSVEFDSFTRNANPLA